MTNEAEIQIGVLCAELRKSKRESDKALAQQIGELTQAAIAAARAQAYQEGYQDGLHVPERISDSRDDLLRQQARRDALNEAAQVVERRASEHGDEGDSASYWLKDTADEIRAIMNQ